MENYQTIQFLVLCDLSNMCVIFLYVFASYRYGNSAQIDLLVKQSSSSNSSSILGFEFEIQNKYIIKSISSLLFSLFGLDKWVPNSI